MSDTTLVSFLPVSESQAGVALGAMKAVADAEGEPRPADREALIGAARHILYSPDADVASLPAPTPEDLAKASPTETYRRYILQLIAVMSFVDGSIDYA